mgnify:CR=1 FL=1
MSFVIYVASTNKAKLDSVHESFRRHFNEKINIIGIDVESDVPNQPIDAECLLGCTNRKNNLVKHLNDNNLYYDFIISIENGVVKNYMYKYDDTETYDFCEVLMFDNKGTKYHGNGGKTLFPSRFYDQSVESEQEITCGYFIEQYYKIKTGSWHEHFNNRKQNRCEIITCLLERLIHSYKNNKFTMNDCVYR